MLEQQGDPLTEAIQVLDQLVRECGTGDPDVKMVLRRCMYASHLIGDTEGQERFGFHINGFPKGSEVPDSRKISGRIRWKTEALVMESRDYDGEIADKRFGINPAPELNYRESIEKLQARTRTGLYRPSEAVPENSIRVTKMRSGYPPSSYQTNVTVYPWDVYPDYNFKFALDNIRNEAFGWAMTTVTRLKYESRIATIWDKYRAEVDSKLAELSLTNHLAALDRQLGSSNEQEWRSALYSCRNMLRDVADYLWEVEGKTVKLPDKDGEMVAVPVNKEKYIIRLNAYLFYKTKSNDETRLSRTEGELLGELIGRINTLDSNAHEKTDRELAEAAALHTYMVISNLIRLTDMEPLTALPN